MTTEVTGPNEAAGEGTSAPPPLSRSPPPPPIAARFAADAEPPHVIWGTIVAFVLAGVVASLIYSIGSPKDSPPGSPVSPPIVLLLLVSSAGTFAFLAVFWSRKAPEGLARRLLLVKPNVRGHTLWLLLPATWVPWMAGGPLLWLGTKIFGDDFGGLGAVFGGYSAASWEWKIAFLPVLTVGIGTGEELFFRGYLQQGLRKANSTLTAVVITALLFSAAHLPPARMMFVLPVAFWLSFLAIRTGSILPGILCHAFVNLTGHCMLAMDRDPTAVFVTAGVLGVPAFCLALRILRRSAMPPASPSVVSHLQT